MRLRTGAPWHDLPDRYPPYQTCHRRFQDWRKNGVFRDLLTCLAEDLRRRGKIDLTEGFVDGRGRLVLVHERAGMMLSAIVPLALLEVRDR